MIEVEICCNSIASAKAAKEGGAKRIELCQDLEYGGLTPKEEDIKYCVNTLGLRTHVLIRPRKGDFYYNEKETEEIYQSIELCKKIGVHAVVLGFLTKEGKIDVEKTKIAVEKASYMEVTFHRAYDQAKQDLIEALKDIADCGCHRLLTSGQKLTALEGAKTIKQLVGLTSVKILAGSGVTPENVLELINQTGVKEVHGSCKTTLPNGTIQTITEQVKDLFKKLNY